MLRRECEEAKAGARRVCHGAISINQVRDGGGLDEVVTTEIVRSGQILDMFFNSFIKVELALSKLQINLKIQLDQL